MTLARLLDRFRSEEYRRIWALMEAHRTLVHAQNHLSFGGVQWDRTGATDDAIVILASAERAVFESV